MQIALRRLRQTETTLMSSFLLFLLMYYFVGTAGTCHTKARMIAKTDLTESLPFSVTVSLTF